MTMQSVMISLRLNILTAESRSLEHGIVWKEDLLYCWAVCVRVESNDIIS